MEISFLDQIFEFVSLAINIPSILVSNNLIVMLSFPLLWTKAWDFISFLKSINQLYQTKFNMEDYLGSIRAFAGNFAPKGFAACNGQLIQISNNSALFAILGTTYGGDGQSTFGLPDLRGRSIVGAGQGPGLSNYVLGRKTGSETTNILISNMPAHNHTAISTMNVNNEEAEMAVPVAGSALAAIIDGNATPILGYTPKAPNTPIAGGTVATTVGLNGGSLPISILQPTLAINYVICVEGMFPSRN